jgi:uncharacterized protein (TIGR03435 family)
MKNAAITGALSALCCCILAQGPVSPTFDVASVRPAASPVPGKRTGFHGGPGTSDPGRIRALEVSLRDLIVRAWSVNAYQVIGPDWISLPPRAGEAGRYDVIANVPAGATREQATMMWRNLLTDRFAVVLHHASKEFAAKDLVVVKSGAKLTRSTIEPAAPALETSDLTKDQVTLDKAGCIELIAPAIVAYATNGPNGMSECMSARGQSISQLAIRLSERYGRPVVDKTGLTGTYDFTIRSGREMDFADDMQRQLGLKLVDSKATVEVIVIDKANKMPSEN